MFEEIVKDYIAFCGDSPWHDIPTTEQFTRILEDIVKAPTEDPEDEDDYPCDYIDAHYPYMPQDDMFYDCVVKARKIYKNSKMRK